MTENVAGRVLLEREGELAWVTLSHPGRLNAITVGMWQALRHVFERIAADAAVRCVIVRGEGGNFAAGADIREFPAQRADMAGVQRYHREVLAPALQAVAQCPQPVVAQIEGVCVGGGLEIASLADIRICGESSRFGVPIKNLGLVMSYSELAPLVRLVGPSVALQVLLEGNIFDAEQALRLGVVTRVEPDDQVAAQARATARLIADGAPLVARWHKKFIRNLTSGKPLTDADRDEAFDCFDTEDFRAGYRAFLAKAKPQFTGR